jgi:single-strand DNA-binding protein
MNKIIVTAVLGRDIELKYTTGGAAIGSCSVAVKRKFVKEGYQDTDWMNIKALGKRAETMAQYLSKGSKVLIEGSFQIDQYEKDGEKKTFPYIMVDNFEFLDSKKKETHEDNFHAVDDSEMDSIPF